VKLLTFIAIIIFLPVIAQAEPQSKGSKVIAECWDKGGSHVAIVECENEVAVKLRNKLQKIYDERLLSAKMLDEDMKKIGSAVIQNEQVLRKSQEAFEDYISAECARQQYSAGTGTIGADYYLGCEINLLYERIERLQ
jgi:uncharacterized protein YecT (DUF1311 family)